MTALTPLQLEFLAEDEFVVIIPKYSQPAMHLVTCGEDIQPFSPALPVRVPVWLAVHLRQQDKCRIKPPEWLDVDFLKDRLAAERGDPYFEPLPFHYVELAEQLLAVAPGDFPDPSRLRTLLKDIADQRGLKLHDGLRQMDGDTAAVKLNNLSAMECNSVRDFLATGMDVFFKLKDEAEPVPANFAPRTSSSIASELPARGLRDLRQ